MNDGNVLRMQQEAAQRVQRMAERSRRLVREHPVNVYRGVSLTRQEPPAAAEPKTVCEPEKSICEEKRPACTCDKTGDKGWLSFLAGDQERALLLLLILVLGKNGAPAELLLALLYVAL